MWYFTEMVFCTRKWEQDRKTVSKSLLHLRDYPEKYFVRKAPGSRRPCSQRPVRLPEQPGASHTRPSMLSHPPTHTHTHTHTHWVARCPVLSCQQRTAASGFTRRTGMAQLSGHPSLWPRPTGFSGNMCGLSMPWGRACGPGALRDPGLSPAVPDPL